MLKRLRAIIPLLALVILMQACSSESLTSGYSKYSYEIIGAFDTVIQFIGYSRSDKDFEDMVKLGEARFLELHKLFNIYNNYEGISNIKTINDNAGIKPVKVRQEILDLILFSKDWHQKTSGKVNIALGPVLSLWHVYREAGLKDQANASIPPLDILTKAAGYTDINKVIVDTGKSTVFLEEKQMSLDVGAVAKGFATQIVADELIGKGFTSFIISSGGNVKVIGKPLDASRAKWGIGIQNPNGNPLDPQDIPLDTAYIDSGSLVTSGDYQRYYEVDGKRYHHLIDPETLMPGNYYRSVAIMTEDSGVADFLSSTLFLLPYDESRDLVDSLSGVEALWIFPDGSMNLTDNMKKTLKNLGGAVNK